MRQIRKRLTYANVMSSLAVFLVIGGGAAFAAVDLPANSVGSRQIKTKAVKTRHIAIQAIGTGRLAPEAAKAGKIAKDAIVTNRLRDNAVATSKIQDEAILAGKIANEAVLADKIANGAVNAAKLGPITAQTETVNVGANSIGSANVDCPAGQRAISGGGSWSVFAKELSFLATRPIRSSADSGLMADGEVAGGWRASGYNESGSPASILVWVLCLG